MKEIIEKIKLNEKVYSNIIEEEIKQYSYRHQRFSHDFSIAIGLSKDELELGGFANGLRVSDRFFILDEDRMGCAVFDCTNTDQGVKAAANMISKFEMSYFSKHLFVSLVSSSEHDDPESMVSMLFALLYNALEKNLSNVVVDSLNVADSHHFLG